MYWLTSLIETNVAYASCMLLFALLVLSVRSRKAASKHSYSFYTPPLRTVRRPAPKYKPMQSSQWAPAAVQPCGPLFNSSQEDAIHEKAKARIPVNPADTVGAPLEFPFPQISDEVKMNSPSFPFESLDPIALAEVSTFAVPAAALSVLNEFPSPLSAYGLIDLEEPGVHEIAITAYRNSTNGNGSHASDAKAPDESGAEDLVMFPQAQTVEADIEKKAPPTLLSFYGLNQQPFDVTPDPSYLYLSSSHREALSSLKQGIEHFRGFMMLVAEPGMGKTTLLHKLMEELTETARVVFLFQTQCSSRELLCYILNELEVDHSGMDVVAMHRALNQALLEEMLRGRRFVLVVDEAQNLQEPVLETIRLLSDFETTHSKLIQIVLAGQPQLAETLLRDSLVQLRQRIAVLSSLNSLTAPETAEYIDYRLRVSGWSGQALFTRNALAQIAESSGGVPRSINNTCFNALLEAFHRGLQVVDADIVKEVAGKLNLESLVRCPQSPANAQLSAAPAEIVASAPIAAAPVAPLAPETVPAAVPAPEAEIPQELQVGKFIGPLPNPDVILKGNLTEKVRSQGWSKHHEYRILVSLERDPVSGLPVADRYYCCSIYVDEAQAATLKPGKPVRIKIEQD